MHFCSLSCVGEKTNTFSFLLCVCVCVSQRSEHDFPKLDFTQDELQKRFERQLAIEQACTVTIDSVEAAKPISENMAKMVSQHNFYQLEIFSRYYSICFMNLFAMQSLAIVPGRKQTQEH